MGQASRFPHVVLGALSVRHGSPRRRGPHSAPGDRTTVTGALGCRDLPCPRTRLRTPGRPPRVPPRRGRLCGFCAGCKLPRSCEATSTSAVGLEPHGDGFSQAHDGPHALRGVLQDVVGWAPRARFAEDRHRRAAELEHCLLRTADEGLVEGMALHDATDSERAKLDEAKPAEVARRHLNRRPTTSLPMFPVSILTDFWVSGGQGLYYPRRQS